MPPVTPAAPGLRATADDVRAEAALLDDSPLVQQMLNSAPAMGAVLNQHRQILMANRKLVDYAGACDVDEVRGLRLGEVLECIRSREGAQGCGTAEGCSVCGALRTILTAQLGHSQTHVCRMRRQGGPFEECAEFEVRATPLELRGQHLTLVYLSDISDRIRREWLDRALLPEARRLAREIDVLSSRLLSDPVDPGARAATILSAASRKLADLLMEPAELAAPEAASSRSAFKTTSAAEMCSAVIAGLDFLPEKAGREVRVENAPADVKFETDPALLVRVIRRLLTNALEATPEGGLVRLGFQSAKDTVEFWIHNVGEVARPVQLQIFQRSFSTKGPGRGFGTHFAKTMAERNLRGGVSFESSPETGTRFYVRLPLTAQVAG